MSSAGGKEMGVAVSSSHVVCAAPSSSGGGLLTRFPCPNVGSLAQGTVLHAPLQCESFPWAAILHKLLQHESLPQGAVLQEQTAPAWVPHGVTSLASKPAPPSAPLCMGPQVLAGTCSSVGSPRGHRILRASTCSGIGSSLDYRWIPALLRTSKDCRGSLPHHGLHHGLQGSLCFGTWST